MEPANTQRTAGPSAGLAPAPRAVIKQFEFLPVWNGLSRHQGTIYRWEIFSGDERIGVYIGKTDQKKPKRRVRRYRWRVDCLQRGEPYSDAEPDGYRKVHRALEAALHHGHRIVLTALSAAQPGLSLDELESRFIREHDSYGPAPHQLNEKP